MAVTVELFVTRVGLVACLVTNLSRLLGYKLCGYHLRNQVWKIH